MNNGPIQIISRIMSLSTVNAIQCILLPYSILMSLGGRRFPRAPQSGSSHVYY